MYRKNGIYRGWYYLPFQSFTRGLETHHSQMGSATLSINYFPSDIITMITAPHSPKFDINIFVVFQDI